MTDFGRIRTEVLSFFLSEYPIDSAPRLLESVVRDLLLKTYNPETVDRFWLGMGKDIQGDIVGEFNRRLEEGGSLRFTLLEDSGEKVGGYATHPSIPPILAFQDALQQLSPSEFEALSAAILKIAGCHAVWTTPASHDQGLDGFGYASFFTIQNIKWPAASPHVVFLAQAKHYDKYKVSSAHIREFVGASNLAKHEIYAVQGEKYKDLVFRACSPVALVYLTSGEVSRSAKTLAHNAGIVLLSSDEIFALFYAHWKLTKDTAPKVAKVYLVQLRKECEGLKQAT